MASIEDLAPEAFLVAAGSGPIGSRAVRSGDSDIHGTDRLKDRCWTPPGSPDILGKEHIDGKTSNRKWVPECHGQLTLSVQRPRRSSPGCPVGLGPPAQMPFLPGG